MPEFRACKRHAKANRVNVSPRSSRPNLVPTALRPSEVRLVTSARGPSSLLQRDTCLVRETERRFATLSEPAVLEAQRGEEERRTGKEGGGEKGGREDGQQGVPPSSRKVSAAMSIQPKWRRADCSVATGDGGYVLTGGKTATKDGDEGEGK